MVNGKGKRVPANSLSVGRSRDMDIRKAIEAEHSKRQTLVIVKYIGSEPALLDELRLIVRKHLPYATVAFQKRAREILY
jgi:hypothetical protein